MNTIMLRITDTDIITYRQIRIRDRWPLAATTKLIKISYGFRYLRNGDIVDRGQVLFYCPFELPDIPPFDVYAKCDIRETLLRFILYIVAGRSITFFEGYEPETIDIAGTPTVVEHWSWGT